MILGNKMNKTIDNALILTMFTAFLYTASVAHFNAYLSTLGIESDFITRTTEQILYYSIFVVGAATIILGMILLIVASVSSILLMSFLRYLIKDYRFKRFLVKLRNQPEKKGNLNSFVKLEEILGKIIKVLVIIFIVPLIFIGIMAYFEMEGKKKANELLNEISKDEISESQLIERNNLSNLFLVTCGVNNCAAIDVKEKTIIYFESSVTKDNITNKLKSE